MAVVKANAYGHGSVEFAKTAQKVGVYYFAVATIDEAITLRKGGINQDILLLSQPPYTSIPLLLEYDILPSVFTSDFAIMYAEAADKQSKLARFHLAINTGMNRIGVRHNEVVDFLKLISFHRALKIEGTFTHFATADSYNLIDFEKQYNFFCNAIEAMKKNGYDPGIVHCANSAAAIRFPKTHFDMVRLGICMYGYHPSIETKKIVHLKPVMSVHARITDERILALGEGVSYELNYRARGSVKICTLPLGYADGLNRFLSQKIDFIYKGHRFPQVGNICMDQCMFEIDMNSAYAQQNFNAQIGDEVVLIGNQGDSIITLEDYANILHTIHYECACAFSNRLPAIYI